MNKDSQTLVCTNPWHLAAAPFFVIVQAFYLVLLTIYHLVRSAYILSNKHYTFLHSWEYFILSHQEIGSIPMLYDVINLLKLIIISVLSK